MIKKWQIVTASMLLSLLSFKVQANVKFIVDNKPGELVFGYEALCVDKGYSVKASDCAEGMVGNSCPYSDEYVDKCLTPTEWCTANGYGKVASDCVKPEYPYEACPKDGTRFKSCLRDNGRACQEDNYYLVCNETGELVFGYEALCVDKGYSVKASDCAEGMVGNSCPYSDEYVDKCLTPTEWCTANGYGKVASDCVKPEYPYEACPKDGTRFKSCLRDNGRACQEDNYYLVCNETGTIPDTSAAGCPYDTSYKKCVCNPCEGYTYTLAEATAQGYVAGPSCNSCGTVKYMRLPADCGSYVECDCGGIGTACWSGTKKLYASCQSCCENRCSIADSDRQDGILYEYEECSGKYCDIGCAMGYEDLDNYWCDGALRCLVK